MGYEESKASIKKYLEKQYQVRFWIKPDIRDRWEAAARQAGYSSMRSFYVDAIEEKIKNSKK